MEHAGTLAPSSHKQESHHTALQEEVGKNELGVDSDCYHVRSKHDVTTVGSAQEWRERIGKQ